MESLNFNGTPKVLNNDKNPCFKCTEINRIAIIYIIAVGVWPKNPNLFININSKKFESVN